MATMTRILPQLFLFTTAVVTAPVHAQFTDDFNDQDLGNGPVWSGSPVFIANAAGELQLNDVVAASSHHQSNFVMPSLDNMEWRVQVSQTFAPSSSNYGRVYLASDQADLLGALNGYYLQFGEAGSTDAVELFRQSGTTSTSVCRGPDGQISASFTVGVQVKRDGIGTWILAIDPDGGTDFIQQATGTDATWTSSAHLGVQCVYTVSNADNFFYDDIYAGPIIVDATPPSLLGAVVVNATQVDLSFDEALDPATVTPPVNYAISGGLATSAAAPVDATTVRITVSPGFTSGTTYTVTVDNVSDLAGNPCVAQTADFLYFVADVPMPGDVIINELLADPTPVVGLPEAEFLELYNTTTDKVFDLAGWTISDGSATGTLPSVTLGPGDHVILADDGSAALFSTFGPVAAISTLPTLNNDGDPLELRSAGNALIDAVTYALSWYQDPLKEDGGWSLERIDPSTPCSGAANWRASVAAAGGTPGIQNSVLANTPDNTPPTIASVLVGGITQVQVVFSEAMNVAGLSAGDYVIEPPVTVDAAVPEGLDGVLLQLGAPLIPGQFYILSVGGVSDCIGNPIAAGTQATFALPEPVQPGDVVINEVLYDPLGSGSDFVELYNRSSKVLSLAGWQLANESGGIIGSATVITTEAVLLLPGDHVFIAENVANIALTYPGTITGRALQADMPSYNNGEGVVVLQDPAGITLDRFAYSDDLHFELLNSTDGVSLERVGPDRPTDDPTNWHSASERVGYATPGYRNSQYAAEPTAPGALNIAPAIFSPDNDGFQDLLNIGYRFDAPGFTGTLAIFDVAGREVVRLLDNELLGTTGTVSWNGVMTGGELARMGAYVVVMEAFDLSGRVERYRETIALAHKL